MAYKKIVLEGDATVDIFADASLQLSSESFADNDTSLMTSAAINDRIEAVSSNTNGTVTSIGGTGTVSGLTLSGTVTSSGNLTLGGTLSVATANIQAGAVTNAKLADNAVQGDIIADQTIAQGKLADNSVETDNIINLNVTTAKLANDAVDDTKLADNAVGSEHIQADAVSASELNVSGNGTSGQALVSDGDGSFSFASVGDITRVTITTDSGSGGKASDDSGSADFSILGSTGINVTNIGNSINVSTHQDISTSASPTFNNLTLDGDLTVSGTTITTNTETLEIADNTMVLNSDLSGSAVDAGFVFERGSTGDNRNLHWDESAGKFITNTNSSAALGGTYQSDMTQTEVNASFSNSSSKVPVGHFQWDGSSLYVRTS
tara:strand:- start:520 stop:1653 length:1134 start_codon:yes stop_codon:yes gene_type:complete